MDGVVKDGAVMAGESALAGNNDIFLSQLSVTTGHVNWINQMGTSENERMAHGGGITVDPLTGNAIVLAQTEGGMYRQKAASAAAARQQLATNSNEVVLFSVASDGPSWSRWRIQARTMCQHPLLRP
jgi:hypothetical protein